MTTSGNQDASSRGGHAFDAEDRLKDVVQAPLTVTDGTQGEVATYGYDALDRLTSMALTLNGNAEPGASYVYDAANEMTSKTEGASTQSIYHGRTYGFGPAHAPWYLTSNGQDEVVAHDADGNLCSTWVGGTSSPTASTPPSSAARRRPASAPTATTPKTA